MSFAKQLCLFTQFEDTNPQALSHVEKTQAQTSNYRNSPKETDVSVYMLTDNNANKSYVGISQAPDQRIIMHFDYGFTNKKMKKVLMKDKENFNEKVLYKIHDPAYHIHSDCRSIMVESFFINFYDTIRNGYNQTLPFYHDYSDSEFWLPILPEEFRGIYLTLDYQMLNERARPYIRKGKIKKNKVTNKHVDHAQLRAKSWAREYIKELMNREIKVRKLVFDAGMVDRSNFYRFLNKNESTNISLPLLFKIIRYIEDVVGLEKKEYDPDNREI